MVISTFFSHFSKRQRWARYRLGSPKSCSYVNVYQRVSIIFDRGPIFQLLGVCNHAGWWFGTFFIFPYIWNNHPSWLIFFRGVDNHQPAWLCSCVTGPLDPRRKNNGRLCRSSKFWRWRDVLDFQRFPKTKAFGYWEVSHLVGYLAGYGAKNEQH